MHCGIEFGLRLRFNRLSRDMMLLGKKVSVTDAEGRDCTWTVVSQRIDGHVQVATSSLAISALFMGCGIGEPLWYE